MIYLASDHGGFEVKERVKTYLKQNHIQFKDVGPTNLNPDDDYPDYVIPAAEAVAATDSTAILACRSGQGAAIVANKVPGVRAVVCQDEECVRSSRNDDDANILSLPADYLTDLGLVKIVKAWLETPFSADARHLRRINKIKSYEAGQ